MSQNKGNLLFPLESLCFSSEQKKIEPTKKGRKTIFLFRETHGPGEVR